jgi:hypothetical protein
MAYSRVHSNISLEGIKKIKTEPRMAGVTAGIRREHL